MCKSKCKLANVDYTSAGFNMAWCKSKILPKLRINRSGWKICFRKAEIKEIQDNLARFVVNLYQNVYNEYW